MRVCGLPLFVGTAVAFQIPLTVTPSSTPATAERTFTLKHAVHLSPFKPALYHTYDSPSDLLLTSSAPKKTLKIARQRAFRPSSSRSYQAARRSSFYTSKRASAAGRPLSEAEILDLEWAENLEWEEDEIEVPDVKDVGTLRQLAIMSNNAYSLPVEEWWDLDGNWNSTQSFGWLEDGLRGHVFADDGNQTIVVVIKGTSVAYAGGGSSPTSRNDKTNVRLRKSWAKLSKLTKSCVQSFDRITYFSHAAVQE
ncbi:lipase ATG15, partial [Phenoliferia sp. Uapishka_3]